MSVGHLSRKLIVSALFGALSAGAQGGLVLHVDDDAPAGGDGLSWETAYRFLQDALDHAAASAGTFDEIRLGPGVYRPDRSEVNPDGLRSGNCCEVHEGAGCDDPDCSAAVCAISVFCCNFAWESFCVDLAEAFCEDPPCRRQASFQLLDGVSIKGGFLGRSAGPGQDPDERDIARHHTILSGDLRGNDDPAEFPQGRSFLDNSYHVVTGSSNDPTAALDGVTITAGIADGAGAESRGGALITLAGSPTVTECIFRRNYAAHGGAMYNEDAEPAVEHCLFDRNVGDASSAGAAMLNEGSNPVVVGCTFIGNVGGAMHSQSSDPTVINCSFSGNRAANGGAALHHAGGAATVINCTFAANVSASGAGGIQSVGAAIAVANCILWSNVPTQIGGAPALVSFSDVQGGVGGLGNIDANPLFVRDPDDGGDGFGDDPLTPGLDESVNDDYGDLRLTPGSPCIDAGDNTALAAGIDTDLTGSARFVDDPDAFDSGFGTAPIVDMGAYEFDFDCNGNTIPDVDEVAGGTSEDCNGNGIPDECDVMAGASPDCNANGAPDACDLLDGTSEDCNGNGLPDECDVVDEDCNGNGTPDACDLASGSSLDCNGNGLPDECDIDRGFSDDCNGNGVPDPCDVRDGASADCNLDGTPDECEDDCNENGTPDACDVQPFFFADSGPLSPIGGKSPQSFLVSSPPAAPGEVTLTIRAVADLESAVELVEVDINGVVVGTVFQATGTLCPLTPDEEPLTVPASVYNGAVSGGDALITMTASMNVQAPGCGPENFIAVTVHYDLEPVSDDVNGNVVPDECECIGDITGDSVVDIGDLTALIADWGQADSAADVNGDGVVDVQDLTLLILNWGGCG